MIKGHLLQLYMKIPLSIERLSAGRPASYHSLIWTSSVKILYNVKSSDTGISNSLHLRIHDYNISYLYSLVNGPKYAIDAAANTIFPIKFFRSSSNFAAFVFQRSASVAKPPTNFSARINWTWAVFYYYLRVSLFFIEFSKFLFKLLT